MLFSSELLCPNQCVLPKSIHSKAKTTQQQFSNWNSFYSQMLTWIHLYLQGTLVSLHLSLPGVQFMASDSHRCYFIWAATTLTGLLLWMTLDQPPLITSSVCFFRWGNLLYLLLGFKAWLGKLKEVGHAWTSCSAKVHTLFDSGKDTPLPIQRNQR